MPQKIFNACDIDVTSVAQSVSVSRGTSPAQLTLFPEIPSSQYLTVEAVPPDQRVSPAQERYILILKPSSTRIAGQFFDHEIDQIVCRAKAWNWMVDDQGRLRNLDQLELLVDRLLGGQL